MHGLEPGHPAGEELSLANLLGISRSMLNVAVRSENIRQDRYDDRAFGELLEESSELDDLSGQGGNGFLALLQDIWASYYKGAPELVPEEQVSPTGLANRPFVERLRDDPETERTRVVTMFDELAAGLATIATGQQLLKEYTKRPELQDLGKRVEAIRGAEVRAHRGVAGATEEAAALIEGLKRASAEAGREIRLAMRAAVQAGQKAANDMEATLAGWGLESRDLASVPIGERLELMRRLQTPRMRRLAEQVGRMRNLARARQARKPTYERGEIHGITLGNSLERVLPAELAALGDPDLEMDFYKRFTEGQLMQYELRDREKQGRGPIVVLIDCSGSMAGSPLDWATSVALALVDTATRQRRRAVVVLFNYGVVREVAYEPGERDPEKFVLVGTAGADGGTDYEAPLGRALELVGQQPYRHADVVMVTDGICEMSPGFLERFLAEKRSREFRAYAILAGTDYYRQLREWADRVWEVQQFTDEVAADLFEDVY